MKQSGKGKYFKRIGITLIVMATIFLGMGQANAIPVVSTLGNPTGGVQFDIGTTVGQAFTTGTSVTIGTATFLYGYNYTPTSGAYLTIQNNNGAGQIGSSVYDTWNTHSTSGNQLTYSGNFALSANTTYWLVLHDTVQQGIAWTTDTSYVANYGASLPSTYNNYDSAGSPTGYFTLADGPTNFAVNPVPIPGALLLFGSGLLGLVGIGRKRLRK